MKKRYSKYTVVQKLDAINHYFEHGQCISRTVEIQGYPSRTLLEQWIESKNDCPSKLSLVIYFILFSEFPIAQINSTSSILNDLPLCLTLAILVFIPYQV